MHFRLLGIYFQQQVIQSEKKENNTLKSSFTPSQKRVVSIKSKIKIEIEKNRGVIKIPYMMQNTMEITSVNVH